MDERSARWLHWIEAVRARLRALEFGEAPPEAREFFAWNYTLHTPEKFDVPVHPAMAWSMQDLRRLGGGIEVEVQAGRDALPDYEIRASELRRRMWFEEFLDRIEDGAGNDLYITAGNAAANPELNRALTPSLAPLPPMLRPGPAAGLLWIGGQDTITSLHHDLSQNLLVQHVGMKQVRLIPPFEQPKLDNHLWVHSRLGWLSDEVAAERRIAYRDYALWEGEALFIPVGWWHCVKALSRLSVSSTWTSFWWSAYSHHDFPG